VTRHGLRWAATIWIVFLVVLSLQPLRLHGAIRGTASHIFLHVLLFGFAAVIPLLLSVNRAQECARVICVLGLTGAIEISQGLIYGFRTEWRDLEADGIGVLIAFVAIRFWRFRSPFKWNRIATITRKERA
jgi:glycopeptide antibiotics resistance protein